MHPQSIVHAFVEFCDGSVMAQLGFPSMELPILYALTHPGRLPDDGHPPFRPGGRRPAHLRAGAAATFPRLRLPAWPPGAPGGTAPAVFNAANEAAVAAFLEGRIPFGRISEVIERVLEPTRPEPAADVETVRAADRWARRQARANLEATVLITLLALAVVLGVLIFVHEAGHFVAAKWAGIYVHRFSLGLGSPIRRLTLPAG